MGDDRARDSKVALSSALDQLDAWIAQTSGLDHVRFSYRNKTGHLVTVEATKRTVLSESDTVNEETRQNGR